MILKSISFVLCALFLFYVSVKYLNLEACIIDVHKKRITTDERFNNNNNNNNNGWKSEEACGSVKYKKTQKEKRVPTIQRKSTCCVKFQYYQLVINEEQGL